MKKSQPFMLFGLAACMALITSVLVYNWLQRQPKVVEKVIGSETKTVLQNVLVLATGPDLDRKGKEDKPSSVKVITLEVTPEEGEKLALAATEGKIVLALRNQLNADTVLTRGETI